MSRITNNHPNRGPAARKSKEIAKAIIGIYHLQACGMAAGDRFIDSAPGLLLVVKHGRVTGRMPIGQLTAHLTEDEIQAVLDLAGCRDAHKVCLAVIDLVTTAVDRRNGAARWDEGGQPVIETIVDGAALRDYKKGLDVACHN